MSASDTNTSTDRVVVTSQKPTPIKPIWIKVGK